MKSMLTDGTFVQLRDKTLCVIVKGMLVGQSGGCWAVSEYNDDLRNDCAREYDIVRIYTGPLCFSCVGKFEPVWVRSDDLIGEFSAGQCEVSA